MIYLNPIKIREAILDGNKIVYCSATEFLIQVGTGRKGSYKTKYRVVGNFKQAFLLYQEIKLDYGLKKRLLMPSSKRPVLARMNLIGSW